MQLALLSVSLLRLLLLLLLNKKVLQCLFRVPIRVLDATKVLVTKVPPCALGVQPAPLKGLDPVDQGRLRHFCDGMCVAGVARNVDIVSVTGVVGVVGAGVVRVVGAADVVNVVEVILLLVVLMLLSLS